VFVHYSSVHSVRSISVLFVHLMFGSTCMTCNMPSSKPISNIMFIDIVLDLGSEATCFLHVVGYLLQIYNMVILVYATPLAYCYLVKY